MGQKNRDRITFYDIANGRETLGQMRDRRFVVCASCPTCRVQSWVDLKAVIAIAGPHLSLWNRRAACKTVIGERRCKGRVFFVAKARPELLGWTALLDGPPTPAARDALTGRVDPPLPQSAD